MNDGGPAFPGKEWDRDSEAYVPVGGMSLRDYYKGQALASVDREQWVSFCQDGSQSKRSPFAECAAWCGQMADAMLAEREK